MTPLEMLAYYDTLDRPLTREELGEAPRHPAVRERDGYFYLFGREYLVPLRKRREEYARRKWRIASHVMLFLRMVPFLRMVFASGSLSMNNTDETSDLDVIIVAYQGRIWITRFLVTFVLWLLRALRRHGQSIAPYKICPNHFITDQSLKIPFQNRGYRLLG